MSRRRRATSRTGKPTQGGPPPPPHAASPPPAPVEPEANRAATLALLLVAGLCILVSVTFRIDDPDVWQHLAVGRAIWTLGRVPFEHLWTWPHLGEPDVLPSWGFRALLWPFWSAGGLWGLAAWRWITALAAFALLWRAARVLGARGSTLPVVLVIAALTYRLRSQVRPETLVAVLLAAQVLVLEAYRRDGRAWRLAWLPFVAWIWANIHLSYYLGLVLIGFHALDAGWHAARGKRTATPASPWPLIVALLAAGAVSFLNPFGGRGLWEPFDFWLHWRDEPIFRTIIELQPLMWESHWRSGLPVLMLGWPVLALLRARRQGFDLAEAATILMFTTLALSTQRFAGLYALIAAPYVARDLTAWWGASRWRAPALLASPARRSAFAAVACVLVSLPEWRRAEYPIGVGLDTTQIPTRACDWIAEHGVRGRGFNPYYFGGYQLWRFWPEKERLPFIDIHQTGSIEECRLYAYAWANPDAWSALDRRRRFDYALLEGRPTAIGERLHEFLDGDSTWALVFQDDAGAVFARREGSLAAVAARFGYRWLPAADAGVLERLRTAAADSAGRRGLREELSRQIAESPHHARALTILATVEWTEGDRLAARAHLIQALATDPLMPGTHQRLGLLALGENRPQEAAREFEAEKRIVGSDPGLERWLGQAYRRAGDLARARRAYRRALRLDPGDAAARDSLASLGG